ncbi:hypothetical protein FOXG_05832 [Fusarium oxysporum f. sp. lycopersici 4287]|uniref:Uncharacterized protein n=2 Tax=Fusarium oxysporum TaxID=5507 RepID=A0A0J9UWR8_FUSO4|nr:hypothetical protein FOXG_05832 [Fusarium oxysporum f. sp. lycopersici 4287]EXK32856.1 hypothetical protein FOMG_11707 [Fusarium oxysporum f. sp. melonis 26406]KNB03288.1 hypothetical protein FOXG_05832 [Fusarium oxysporum f. sp. lycopersici 4287]
MANDKPYKPALIIVDFQEDFCPPSGSLAVPSGRTIASPINHLTTLPFSLILATKDFHPSSHISFASNHASSTPYTSTTTIQHPDDPSQSYTTTLWPTHCVQGTPGCELVPELDVSRVHAVIEKGQDERVEMYSAFYDPFRPRRRMRCRRDIPPGLLMKGQSLSCLISGRSAREAWRTRASSSRPLMEM